VGEVGHLMVKGEATAPYYSNKEEQTKRTMQGDWLKTGDTYYRDEEEFLNRNSGLVLITKALSRLGQ